MRKRIAFPGIAALGFVIACAAVLYLSYGLPSSPSQAHVPGLGAPARLVVYENGSAAIDAASARDAYAGLGYLHAQEHAWAMTLWQRTARGALSPWLGEELLTIDRLARRLRFASMGKAAYAALSPDDQALLNAYANGANAALARGQTRRSPEFLLLGGAPEPWEPWFPLALERLFAWLSTTLPQPDSLQNAPPALDALRREHRLLQEWLHLHGFDHSMAWAIADSAGTHLTWRQVYGASALPLFQEVAMAYPGETAMGAVWIGTPFMPAGRTSARSWAILPASAVSLRRFADDAPRFAFEYEKWTVAGGKEVVTRFRRDEGALFLGTDSLSASHAALAPAAARSGPDSTAHNLYLTWPGWEPVSDAAAWFGLISGKDAPFALQDGDGLLAASQGSLRIAGSPLFAVRRENVLAVGNNPWSALAARRLVSHAESAANMPEAPADADDLYSTWAAHITPRLIETLSSGREDARPALFEDALAYLLNWDYAFDAASIPATIADAWAGLYFESTGMWPGLSADSAADRARPETHGAEQQIMERAVALLADRFGANPERWRWENAQPHTWYFPVWSANDASLGKTSAAAKRYAPIQLPGAGHVTTLQYGISQSEQTLPAPALWEGWISTSAWQVLRYRVRRFPVQRPFGRYLIPEHAPRPAVLRANAPHEENGEPIRYVAALLPE